MKPMTPTTFAHITHWIFDLDGTLTVAVHDFAAIRRELKIPDGVDILDHLTALPSHCAEPLHARLQEIEQELSGLTQAAEGALQLLEQLHKTGAPRGILTRNTRNNAMRTLELIGLSRFFDPAHILGRDEVPPKPDPEGIHHLIRLWETSPESAVMVGDYQYDLQAGRSAGALTIHVDAARAFRWPDLTDVSVASLAELIECIPQPRSAAL
jgi:HAD superfamily hydrolase (TIGR01549 family)